MLRLLSMLELGLERMLVSLMRLLWLRMLALLLLLLQYVLLTTRLQRRRCLPVRERNLCALDTRGLEILFDLPLSWSDFQAVRHRLGDLERLRATEIDKWNIRQGYWLRA